MLLNIVLLILINFIVNLIYYYFYLTLIINFKNIFGNIKINFILSIQIKIYTNKPLNNIA